jgi:hypothetical protein
MVSLLQISGGLILGHSSVNYVIALVTWLSIAHNSPCKICKPMLI